MKKIIVNIFLIILFAGDIAYATGPNYSFGEPLLKLILYMLIIAFVLGLTIFGTRFLAKNSQKFIKSKYMRIIDMLNIGTNTKILMVEIEDYIYIIVINNNSAELIEKIKKDELIKDSEFEDRLTKHTLSYMNMGKIRNILNRNNKLDSEADKDED